MDPNDHDYVGLWMPSRDEQGQCCNVLLDFFQADELRSLISDSKAHFEYFVTRGGMKERRVILNEAAPELIRCRALSGGKPSLSTVYSEDLYPDDLDVLKFKRDNRIALTVTQRVMTLKRYRPHEGFANWKDNDKFQRRRWNPDEIKPMYPTVRMAELALLPPKKDVA